MLKKLKSKKGFTLIELIVVIAVIAILAAILLPQFAGFSNNAREKALLSDARNYGVAVQALIADGTVFNGQAANTTDEDLVIAYVGKTFNGTFSITNVNGTFTLSRTDGAIARVATYNGSTGVVSVTP